MDAFVSVTAGTLVPPRTSASGTALPHGSIHCLVPANGAPLRPAEAPAVKGLDSCARAASKRPA